MSIFVRGEPDIVPLSRLDDAFARHNAAQRKAGSAAAGVRTAAEGQTRVLRAGIADIRQRTAQQQAKARPGQTSDIVHLVEEVLSRPGVRGERQEKGSP